MLVASFGELASFALYLSEQTWDIIYNPRMSRDDRMKLMTSVTNYYLHAGALYKLILDRCSSLQYRACNCVWFGVSGSHPWRSTIIVNATKLIIEYTSICCDYIFWKHMLRITIYCCNTDIALGGMHVWLIFSF